MSVHIGELYVLLKKSLGIIIKKLEEEGVLTVFSTKDHLFIPELTVTDTPISLDLNAKLCKIKVLGNIPVYYNIDRPITNEEYSIVEPGVYAIIPRISKKLYLKAPIGTTSRVRVEVLK